VEPDFLAVSCCVLLSVARHFRFSPSVRSFPINTTPCSTWQHSILLIIHRAFPVKTCHCVTPSPTRLPFPTSVFLARTASFLPLSLFLPFLPLLSSLLPFFSLLASSLSHHLITSHCSPLIILIETKRINLRVSILLSSQSQFSSTQSHHPAQPSPAQTCSPPQSSLSPSWLAPPSPRPPPQAPRAPPPSTSPTLTSLTSIPRRLVSFRDPRPHPLQLID
jgi:hypothetical protein